MTGGNDMDTETTGEKLLPWKCCGCGKEAVGLIKPCDCATMVGFRGKEHASFIDPDTTQPCGHDISLRVKNIESGEAFCELCEARSERDDAIAMETHYQENAKRTEAALALAQEALREIAEAWTAHSYADAMDAVQHLKDRAREAIKAIESAAPVDHARVEAAEIAVLRKCLGYFLEDKRFKVAVGGNPQVVEAMIAKSRAAFLRIGLDAAERVEQMRGALQVVTKAPDLATAQAFAQAALDLWECGEQGCSQMRGDAHLTGKPEGDDHA